MIDLNFGTVSGLPELETQKLHELTYVFNMHRSKNEEKERYYEGHVPLTDVNIGIALPKHFNKLNVSCSWGAKTVDVLASRSMFDGFVSNSGAAAETATRITERNNLLSQYSKACRDELLYGCTFATLSEDERGARIRFHSPQSAAALWDGEKGRIECGLAVIDTVYDEVQINWQPTLVYLYTEAGTWVISREKNDYIWNAHVIPHGYGVPLMVPLVWNATSAKPFGRSRIKQPIRDLIDGYIRTMADAAVGLEFATSPQKYLLGVTDDQYDAVTSDKFKQYVGNILVATPNPDTGSNPSFGQLAQGNIEPHIQMLRALATQFSAATGLSITDTGVINDANPSSSDAILAQTQTLTLLAEQLNRGNTDALYKIMTLATAIENHKSVEDIKDDDKDIVAHFKNPAMPSISATADASIKLASVDEAFAQTSVFYEMNGFDQADIRRIKGAEARARGLNVIQELENGDNEEPVAQVRTEDEQNQ